MSERMKTEIDGMIKGIEDIRQDVLDMFPDYDYDGMHCQESEAYDEVVNHIDKRLNTLRTIRKVMDKEGTKDDTSEE